MAEPAKPYPWNPEHTNRAAYLVQFASGAIAAGCHHHGCAGKDWHALRRLYGDEIVALFRRIKSSFDPQGIFNPGVILPGAEPPISRLKVGEGAVRLPEDIERGLREIEVSGGYSKSRLELAD